MYMKLIKEQKLLDETPAKVKEQCNYGDRTESTGYFTLALDITQGLVNKKFKYSIILAAVSNI